MNTVYVDEELETKEFFTCLGKESIIKSEKYLADLALEINLGSLCLADERHEHIGYYLILNKDSKKVVYKSVEVGFGLSVKYIAEHAILTPEKLKEYLQYTNMIVDIG